MNRVFPDYSAASRKIQAVIIGCICLLIYGSLANTALSSDERLYAQSSNSSSPGPGSTLQVRPVAAHRSGGYEHGETVELSITASTNMDVFCYLDNGAGVIYQIIPNVYRPRTRVYADTAVTISSDNKARVVANSPLTETVMCTGHIFPAAITKAVANYKFEPLGFNTLKGVLNAHQSAGSYRATSNPLSILQDPRSGKYYTQVPEQKKSIVVASQIDYVNVRAGWISAFTGQTLLFAGILAALFGTLAFMPYIADTIKRTTRPHRATWLIWSVLSSISLVSQVYEGAESSLFYVAFQTGCTLLIFGLSVCFGIGKLLYRNDYLILGLAGAGLILWFFTDSAVYALAIAIGVSAVGGLATTIKAYRDPDSETLSTWVLSTIAAVFAIVSVGKLDWVLLAYPVYLFVLYSSIGGAVIAGRAGRLSGRLRISCDTGPRSMVTRHSVHCPNCRSDGYRHPVGRFDQTNWAAR